MLFSCNAPPTTMEFSVTDFLLSYQNQLPDILRKSRLVPSGYGNSSQLQIQKVEEIGDGNLNFVYRVQLALGENSVSVIVKHAPNYIKCLGPSYPLTQQRLEVEYAAMCQFQHLQAQSVPLPVLYNAESSAIVMEDLNGYSILRGELMEGRVEPVAIQEVMTSIGAIHKQSLRKNLTAEKWKELVTKFSNKDMVAITADYVFTNPFQQGNSLNKHHELLNEAVDLLRNDTTVQERAVQLKKLFLENQECLCHGDLHTGSVMVKGQSSKMIDEEFAFLGPSGFDLGAFIANLVFALIRHHCLGNQEAKELLQRCIPAAIECYCSQCGPDISDIDEFVSNACGFIGVELVRRTIGTAHVEDVSSIPEGELIAVQLGHALMTANCSTASRGKAGLVDVLTASLKKKQL